MFQLHCCYQSVHIFLMHCTQFCLNLTVVLCHVMSFCWCLYYPYSVCSRFKQNCVLSPRARAGSGAERRDWRARAGAERALGPHATTQGAAARVAARHEHETSPEARPPSIGVLPPSVASSSGPDLPLSCALSPPPSSPAGPSPMTSVSRYGARPAMGRNERASCNGGVQRAVVRVCRTTTTGLERHGFEGASAHVQETQQEHVD
jgi:hypothetical protein